MNLVRIDELFKFEKGSLQSSKCESGQYDFITASAEWKTHKEYSFDCEALIFAAAASGSLGRTHYVNGKFISSDLCFIITPKNQDKYPVDLSFYHIIFNQLKNDIVKNTKAGTSKEAIGLSSFGKYKLPYFDIEKQILIKNKFLKAQDENNKLNTELSNQLDLVKKLRQQILQDAVQGKLVEQNPDDEPASILLEKIKAEKEQLIKDKKIKKEKDLQPIKAEEIPFDIPDNWVWCRLGDLCKYIKGGGTPSKANPEYWNGNIPWATVKDLNTKYLISTQDNISNLGLNNSSTNLIPKDNVIVCTRMGLGKIVINKINITINQDLKALFISDYIDKEFFYNFYKTISIKGRGMTVEGITQEQLLNFMFTLPPIEEQKRIVYKLEELMKYCDELEQNIKANQQYTEQLMQVALKEALTPPVADEKEVIDLVIQ